ncbi:hypothetical protein FACS1894193_09330 [Bacilli bacterium]|nr:hypothetical protein FACS1894192_02510 [Bacilli bacterium]GHU42569.1 hypothetical protein FACS1894193_08160 [Bacilli bacterium]GHU43068.1 hypothetical protein FACS1894193_09330 [Bacilli bacterium]
MPKISSSVDLAESAVKELVGVDIHHKKNEQFQSSYSSGISAMTHAQTICNQLFSETTDLCQVVLTQANKFPELARLIEQRDREEARKW